MACANDPENKIIKSEPMSAWLITSCGGAIGGGCSPLCVIVDEHVVLHRQLEIWNLLTHPPRNVHKQQQHMSDNRLRNAVAQLQCQCC